MGKLVLVMGLMWLSGQAGAAPVFETNCLSGGCLVSGWTGFDMRSGRSSVVECFGHDCATLGWSERLLGAQFEQTVRCEPEGCFRMGWSTFDRYTGREVSRTICNSDGHHERDCLRFGWEFWDHSPGGQGARFECLRNDCREFGWRVYQGYGPMQTAVCKRGGCFTQGWVIHSP